VVAVLFFAWGFVALDRMLVGYLFPWIVPEFNLSYGQTGLIMTVMALFWALGAPVGGALSDKYGRKKILLPMVVIFSVCSMITGLVRSYIQLIATRLSLGFVEGGYFPTAVAMVEEEVSPKRRGLMISLHNMGFPIIGIVFGATFATQMATKFGWRSTFFLTIVPGIILAAIIYFLLREPPASLERIKVRNAAKAIADQAGGELAKMTFGQLLRYRNVFVLLLISIFSMVWFWNFLMFGMLFLTKGKGLSILQAGFVMSIFGAVRLVGLISVSSASDYVGRKKTILVALLVTGLATIVTAQTESYAILVAGILVAGFFGEPSQTLFTSIIPAESVPIALAGRAIGVILLVGEVIGGGIIPPITGAIADKVGINFVILASGFSCLISCALAFLLTETAPRKVAAAFRGGA